jgi:1,6-anhydro-N-acetylmuramate kinase
MEQGDSMDAETRMERKVVAKDRKYFSRYRPKQVGRSVFTIQQVQAKRAEQAEHMKGGRVEKPSRSHVHTLSTFLSR